MKTLLMIIGLTVAAVTTFAQSRDTTITWYGMPFYDTINGRVRLKTCIYTFDHIPTSLESTYVRRVNAQYYKRLPKAKSEVIKKKQN